MTANRAEVLPAELIRKGRIDEVFWVDLPNLSEREAIFRVHLARVRAQLVKSGDFDLKLLAEHSRDFSGAEIEQVIYDGMQSAFSAGEEFGQRDLLASISGCVPLARIAEAQIEDLKAWASRSGAKSASVPDLHIVPRPSLLQVDEN
jgi:SpoVK/Ycf46/Vps4 family AAA+-type ATPase